MGEQLLINANGSIVSNQEGAGSNSQKFSALHMACYKKHTSFVKMLLKWGADVNVQVHRAPLAILPTRPPLTLTLLITTSLPYPLHHPLPSSPPPPPSLITTTLYPPPSAAPSPDRVQDINGNVPKSLAEKKGFTEIVELLDAAAASPAYKDKKRDAKATEGAKGGAG